MSKRNSNQPSRGHGGMNVGLDKPKNFKKTFRRLVGFLRPRRVGLMIVFLVAVLGTTFYVIGPAVLGQSITDLFDGVYEKMQGIAGAVIHFNQVMQLLLLLAGLYVFASLFQFIQQYMMAAIAQRTVYDLREEVFEKINHLPLSYFDGRSHGDILSRVTNDIDTIATTLQQSM